MKSYERLQLEDMKTKVTKALFTHLEDSLEILHEVAKEVDGYEETNYTDLSAFESYNGFISTSGAWNNINDKYLYTVIPVVGENSILTMTGIDSTIIYYAGVRSYSGAINGEMLDYSEAEGWTSRRVLQKNTSISLVLPIDVKYIIITTFQNNVDTTPINFSLTSEAGGGKVNNLDMRVSNLEKIGVNYIALGDSITEGFYSVLGEDTEDTEVNRAGENSYVSTLSKLKGFNLTNKGVGGSGWLKRGTTAAPKLNAREQIDATNEDGSFVIDFTQYDLCTLCWGVNDWKGKENLGTFEDGLNPETESVCANIRYCIETILQRNPNIKLIVISPVNCRMDTSSNPSTADNNWGIGYSFNEKTLKDFYDAIKNICDYYGIEFVDMLYTSVINRVNAETLLPDKVHPSLEAHKLMGKELAGKIKYGC